MIKRENLKKGDTILIVPNSDYTRDNSVSKVEITAIGPKYITVATKWDDGHYGISTKFHNDNNMSEKDYSSRRLFLGTEEEYEETKKLEKITKELYYEINSSLNRNLPYEKLLAIKTIIEADSVDDAMAKMHYYSNE
jgi:hypothetical protein